MTGTPMANAANQIVNAFDNDVNTLYSSWSSPCYVGIDVGYGTVAKLSKVSILPQTSGNGRILIAGIHIEGSQDGTTYTDLFTILSTPTTGWSSYDMGDGVLSYRYMRAVKYSGRCLWSELEFYGKEFTSFPDIAACPIQVSCNVILPASIRMQCLP